MKRKVIKYTIDFSKVDERLREKRYRKLQLKLEDEARRREIIVGDISDLIEKYKNHGIEVDISSKIVSLREPLEVKYLPHFRYECNCLGFECEIGGRNIRNLYL